MQNLQILIDQLSRHRKLHISILDLSGILNTPLTQISIKNAVHTKHFCDIAKSTDRGLAACLRCKMLANTKAVQKKKPFSGHCIYGLYEAAYPVIINQNVAAVVYVGNAVIDKERTVSQMKRICSLTGAEQYKLSEEIEQCELLGDSSELFQIAELVADYVKMLYAASPPKAQKMHWLVSLMKQHADEMFSSNISLKELAVTYRKNEKYLGRLFKKEMGIGFGDYCMQVRLHKAEQMLMQSDEKIIDIALECGFNNISYFNRLFKKKHGIPPRAYRAEKIFEEN